MKYFKLVLFIMVVGLPGCSEDKPQDAVHCRAEIKNVLLKSGPGWNTNFKICQHILYNQHESILGYNFNEHKLQALDLETGDTLWQIPLKKEGPEMIPEVVSFYYHSPDSIFVLSFFYISIIDQQGRVLQKHVINRPESNINGDDPDETKVIYCDINHSSPIYYDYDENALYFAFKPLPPFSEKRFEQALCGRISLDQLILEPLPIYLPQKFKDRYYGAYERPTFLFGDDEIVYGFYLDGDLYRYSKKTGKTEVSTVVAKSIEKTAPPMPASASDDDPGFMEHLNTWPTFFRISSDGTFFYRPFVGAFDRASSRTRKKFVMVYDSNLAALAEFPLPDDVAVLASNIATSNGVMFLQMNAEREDRSNFLVLVPDCNEYSVGR